jgi:hypothetical protein
LNLEPHNRLEAALQHLSLDLHALAHACLAHDLDLGVTADPEQAPGDHLQAWKQLVGVRRDDACQSDEHARPELHVHAHAPPLRELARDLDANEHGLVADGIVQLERPRCREVRDERERVSRVQAERRQHR